MAEPEGAGQHTRRRRSSRRRGSVRDSETHPHPDGLFSLQEPPEARSHVFNRLFFNLNRGWQGPFWLMLTLSSGLAVLGLSENSAATVIGAMLVAPLGQPIIALGAAVALGWPGQALRMLALIVLGAVWVAGLAFGVSHLLPVGAPSAEALARTAPDLRDLGIAVLAGTAGAYGYYRAELSTVLSGVAIAVALVPPLCTAGMMLAGGHTILAIGGLLLFTTNLVGITAATILVFFLTGAAHPEGRRGWFLGGTAVTLLATLLILSPLVLNYERIAAGPVETRKIYEAADAALRTAIGHPTVESFTLNGAQLTITVRGLPTDAGELGRMQVSIQKRLGLDVKLVPAQP